MDKLSVLSLLLPLNILQKFIQKLQDASAGKIELSICSQIKWKRYNEHMLNYLSVAVGGAIGTVIRFFVANQVGSRLGGKWPIATFSVNLVGCLLIGWLAVHFEKVDGPKWLQVALIGGLCGGMTTFSTFIFEASNLMQAGMNARSFVYLSASVFFGFIAMFLGMRIASTFVV